MRPDRWQRNGVDAHRPAEEGHVLEHRHDDEVKPDRRDREEVLSQPQADRAQDETGQARGRDRGGDGGPERPAVVGREDGREVATDAEEGTLGKVGLARVPGHDVEAHDQDGIDGQGDQDDLKVGQAHWITTSPGSSPCGRTSRIRISAMKAMASRGRTNPK